MTKQYALTAAAFEGSLVAVAIAIGWLLGHPPLRTLEWDWGHAILGAAAALPLLGLFGLCLALPLPPLQRIVRFLDGSIVPWLRDCGFFHLAVIAGLAGLGEEMLFRGAIQAAIADEIGPPHGTWTALLISSALFGLLHSITPTYALWAGIVSLYLGAIWLAAGNLLVPISAHAIYDFLVLVYMVKWRAGRLEARS